MATWDITTKNSTLEFDTQEGNQSSARMIDNNHFVNFWTGPSDDGFVQTFAVNTSTWAVTTASSSLEFDTQDGYYSYTVSIDSNHFLHFWTGPSYDGFVQTFTVNTSTWAVTTASSSLEFDTQDHWGGGVVAIDSNHYLSVYQSAGFAGKAQVFAVNTSTWAVTTAGSSFAAAGYLVRPRVASLDMNKYLVVGKFTSGDIAAQVFAVNTSTWAVTTAGSVFTISTVADSVDKFILEIDDTHCLLFYAKSSTSAIAQVLAVNTSTWAVTTASSSLEFSTNLRLGALGGSAFAIDTNNFLLVYGSGSNLEKNTAQVFTVNTSTWAVTTAGSGLIFDTSGVYSYAQSVVKVDSSTFINFWRGKDGDGFTQVFGIEIPATSTEANSDRLVYSKGVATSSSDRLVYSEGSDTGSSDRLVYSSGKSADSSDRLLYSSGAGTSSSDRLIYSEGSVLADSDRLIHSKGIDTGSSDRLLYSEGSVNASSDRLIFSKGVNTGSSDRDIHSIGSVLESSERSLYTKGISTSSSERLIYSVGALPGDSDRLIYSSVVDTASSERDIYSVGGGITSSDRLIYSEGVSSGSSDRLIYTEGVDTDNTSERNIYTKGVESTSSERLIYTTGSLVADSDRLVYSSGKEEASSERALYSKSGTTSNRFKRWNGSAWVEATAKRYNGSEWVSAKVKHYNGSIWEDIN